MICTEPIKFNVDEAESRQSQKSKPKNPKKSKMEPERMESKFLARPMKIRQLWGEKKKISKKICSFVC